MNLPFLTIDDALIRLKKGQMLIVVDHKERENEGDLFFPAELVSPEKINTLITIAKGLVCVAIPNSFARRLDLPLLVPVGENTEKTGVNFTISVNAKKGIGSGISAYDRAKTISLLANQKSIPGDFTRPGHVFPLVAHENGLLGRQGHTEAAVTISLLAGFSGTGVLCEIVGQNGKMAKQDELVSLAHKLGIGIVSIDELKKYLRNNRKTITTEKESCVIKTAHSTLPTTYGTFEISVYRSLEDNKEHVVLRIGESKKNILLRLHSQCVTGDIFSSLRCDCGPQLNKSLKLLAKEKNGALIYLNQEGRNIGLTNKIKAYALQDKGMDTVEANVALGLPPDGRDYKIAADILKDLHIQSIRLLTNNPGKTEDLEKHGIHVVEQIQLQTPPNKFNKRYLLTKKNKMRHSLTINE